MRLHEITQNKYEQLKPKKPSGTVPPIGSDTEIESYSMEHEPEEPEQEEMEAKPEKVQTKPGSNSLSTPKTIMVQK